MEGGKATASASGIKKGKKKQVSEFDRMKQAEKKKRRLEKALATSAAIISDLEKKKQKMKEEQERLDEEGAAIAESVALHVLCGEEDSDDMPKKKKNEELTEWDRLVLYHQGSLQSDDWGTDARRYEQMMRMQCRNSGVIAPSDPLAKGLFHPQYFGLGGWGMSADNLAAQAVSSLKIGDDARADAYAFNRALRG